MKKKVTKSSSAKHAGTLPSLSTLFNDSWDMFKGSAVNLIILNIVAAGIYIGIFLVALIVSLPLGIIGFISATKANKITPELFSSLGGVAIVLLIAFLAAIIIGFAIQAASILFAGRYKTKPAFGETFKKSFSYILPLFVLGLLLGFLVVGGYFLFVLPGIFFAILFIFAPYEIILNKQGVLSALSRSASIVLCHFWGVLGRILLWVVIVMAVSFIPNLVLSGEARAGYSLIGFVVQIFISLFGIAYYVTLYKEASKGHETDKGTNLLWITLVAIVGWIIGIVLITSFAWIITNAVMTNIEKSQQKQTKTTQQKMMQVSPTSIPSSY